MGQPEELLPLYHSAIVWAERLITAQRRVGMVIVGLALAAVLVTTPLRWQIWAYCLVASAATALPAYLIGMYVVNTMSRLFAEHPEDCRKIRGGTATLDAPQGRPSRVMSLIPMIPAIPLLSAGGIPVRTWLVSHTCSFPCLLVGYVLFGMYFLEVSEVWRRRRGPAIRSRTSLDPDRVMEDAGYRWSWLWGWRRSRTVPMQST